MEMIRENDLAGIAIWRLGSEDPQNWTYIRDSLKQDPLIVQRSINRYIPGHWFRRMKDKNLIETDWFRVISGMWLT